MKIFSPRNLSPISNSTIEQDFVEDTNPFKNLSNNQIQVLNRIIEVIDNADNHKKEKISKQVLGLLTGKINIDRFIEEVNQIESNLNDQFLPILISEEATHPDQGIFEQRKCGFLFYNRQFIEFIKKLIENDINIAISKSKKIMNQSTNLSTLDGIRTALTEILDEQKIYLFPIEEKIENTITQIEPSEALVLLMDYQHNKEINESKSWALDLEEKNDIEIPLSELLNAYVIGNDSDQFWDEIEKELNQKFNGQFRISYEIQNIGNNTSKRIFDTILAELILKRFTQKSQKDKDLKTILDIMKSNFNLINCINSGIYKKCEKTIQTINNTKFDSSIKQILRTLIRISYTAVACNARIESLKDTYNHPIFVNRSRNPKESTKEKNEDSIKRGFLVIEGNNNQTYYYSTSYNLGTIKSTTPPILSDEFQTSIVQTSRYPDNMSAIHDENTEKLNQQRTNYYVTGASGTMLVCTKHVIDTFYSFKEKNDKWHFVDKNKNKTYISDNAFINITNYIEEIILAIMAALLFIEGGHSFQEMFITFSIPEVTNALKDVMPDYTGLSMQDIMPNNESKHSAEFGPLIEKAIKETMEITKITINKKQINNEILEKTNIKS